jgi:hypothetical protein
LKRDGGLRNPTQLVANNPGAHSIGKWVPAIAGDGRSQDGPRYLPLQEARM